MRNKSGIKMILIIFNLSSDVDYKKTGAVL